MQDNEVGLEQLKNVYKAQTEAYLDFNMALINILTNQKELLGKVESLKILSDDEFKKLSKDYAILEKLFENSQYTGYCCCPDTDFAIDFYRESQKIETYFADTIKYVDKVQVFEESFQFSFLIDKKKWKSYLMEIENK